MSHISEGQAEGNVLKGTLNISLPWPDIFVTLSSTDGSCWNHGWRKRKKEEDTKFIALPKSSESQGTCHQKDMSKITEKNRERERGRGKGIEAMHSSSSQSSVVHVVRICEENLQEYIRHCSFMESS